LTQSRRSGGTSLRFAQKRSALAAWTTFHSDAIRAALLAARKRHDLYWQRDRRKHPLIDSAGGA
jgi:hypothetical protein